MAASLLKSISPFRSNGAANEVHEPSVNNASELNYTKTEEEYLELGTETDSDFYDPQQDDTPVEKKNPLGYTVGPISVVVLILQGIVGTGIFITPGGILQNMGSVGSTYVLWLTCFFFNLIVVYIYIEFAGYFPKRNGADVAYLEKSYPKPKFFIPTAYAAMTVCLSYISPSCMAMSQYILRAADVEMTTWNHRGIAIGCLSFACLTIAFSTKTTLKLQNILGFIKVLFMIFIVILGWVVLGGHTKVADPHASFRHVWEGTTSDGNKIANSIIDVAFTYWGFNYAFTVVAEHQKTDNQSKEQAHKQLLKSYAIYVPLCLCFIYVFYILMITSFYASATPAQIKSSGLSIAALMFNNVFENKSATKFLDSMIILSCFGHILTAILAHSRQLRECGRQGILPFERFWTSTKPLGTPLGPIIITWIVNFIMIVGPPAGSAYNFIVDMGTYAVYIFTLFLIIGLLRVRRERSLKGLGKSGHYLPLPIIIIALLFELMVLAIAFVPPKGTLIGSDVTFFYATYPIVTIGIFGLCCAYYFVWRYAMPRVGNYVYREVIYKLANGELGNKIIKVKVDEVEEWDRTHCVDSNGVTMEVVDLDNLNVADDKGSSDDITEK